CRADRARSRRESDRQERLLRPGRAGVPQFGRGPASGGLHGGQSREADRIPSQHGSSAALSQARNAFFATTEPPAAPAITLVEVSKLYGPDFMIEIEAVAAM